MLIILYLLWIIFNAKITLEIILLGFLIVGGLYFFMKISIDYSIRKELKFYSLAPLFIQYLVVLFFEILKANFMVIKEIVFGGKERHGEILRFKTELKSEFLMVLFANAITITPGTITVKLFEGDYIVHCLSPKFSFEYQENKIYQILMKMEEKINA